MKTKSLWTTLVTVSPRYKLGLSGRSDSFSSTRGEPSKAGREAGGGGLVQGFFFVLFFATHIRM